MAKGEPTPERLEKIREAARRDVERKERLAAIPEARRLEFEREDRLTAIRVVAVLVVVQLGSLVWLFAGWPIRAIPIVGVLLVVLFGVAIVAQVLQSPNSNLTVVDRLWDWLAVAVCFGCGVLGVFGVMASISAGSEDTATSISAGAEDKSTSEPTHSDSSGRDAEYLDKVGTLFSFRSDSKEKLIQLARETCAALDRGVDPDDLFNITAAGSGIARGDLATAVWEAVDLYCPEYKALID
jgi:hypothetical protein